MERKISKPSLQVSYVKQLCDELFHPILFIEKTGSTGQVDGLHFIELFGYSAFNKVPPSKFILTSR
jgi:hypothetical protein